MVRNSNFAPFEGKILQEMALKQEITAIVGAGPYGLSIAAHLKEQGIPISIFGKPMEFWKRMPPTMYLKSSWSALTLSDPHRQYDLNRFSKSMGRPWQEPVPLQTFLAYGQWFQRHVVPDIDQTYVSSLARDGESFHLELEDGRSVRAGRVIVATGIASFANIPDYARHLPKTLASHSQDHSDFSSFKGQRVVVVGSGQSALESAALLHEAGADVELIARGPINWINRKLYYYTGPIKRLFYPPSDVGPPGINWIVAYPLLFKRLPQETRASLDERSVRPAGAKWLRPRVEGRFRLTPHTTITSADQQGEGLHLTLSDGTTREVDHILLGTGYQANIDALTFIDASLRNQIQRQNQQPVLNDWFESTVPYLHFVGALAGYSFGPLCRFVVGSKIAARQIARHAARGRTAKEMELALA